MCTHLRMIPGTWGLREYLSKEQMNRPVRSVLSRLLVEEVGLREVGLLVITQIAAVRSQPGGPEATAHSFEARVQRAPAGRLSKN